MQVCENLFIPFVIPSYILQDASHSEANAALEVFGSTVMIIMCWFHLVFNVKKHESFVKLKQEFRDMILVDLTRLHYCLQYEFEIYKKIVLDKWSSYPELNAFVSYVVPQWFEGTFNNWQIFIKLARSIDTTKFDMKGLNECLCKGSTHVHTVNFNMKSWTCRWFLAFAVCAHIISACDFYNREL